MWVTICCRIWPHFYHGHLKWAKTNKANGFVGCVNKSIVKIKKNISLEHGVNVVFLKLDITVNPHLEYRVPFVVPYTELSCQTGLG